MGRGNHNQPKREGFDDRYRLTFVHIAGWKQKKVTVLKKTEFPIAIDRAVIERMFAEPIFFYSVKKIGFRFLGG